MSDEQLTPSERRQKRAEAFTKDISTKEARRLKGKTAEDHTIWFGLGMFGVVGWSIAIPTLIGVAAGLWIDKTFPSRYSWTLMFLIAGIALGCMNAWYWVKKARDQIMEE
jgi:ATP synthase protein I